MVRQCVDRYRAADWCVHVAQLPEPWRCVFAVWTSLLLLRAAALLVRQVVLTAVTLLGCRLGLSNDPRNFLRFLLLLSSPPRLLVCEQATWLGLASRPSWLQRLSHLELAICSG